jgi:hypothetical protein
VLLVCFEGTKQLNFFKVKALSKDQLVKSTKMVFWWWLKTTKKDIGGPIVLFVRASISWSTRVEKG